MSDLSTTYLGLKLKNPIIAGSSGLTNSIKDLLALEKSGVSAIVLKSLFEEEIRKEMTKEITRMQKETFIYPETIDFYDSFEDVESTLTNYIQLISEAKEKLVIPIIPSINCVTSEKWPYFATTLEEAGADAIELNVSILPSDLHRTRTANEKLHFEIIEEVIDHVSIPVSIKISYFSSNLAGFIKELCEAKVNGIVLFNRFYSPDFDIDSLEVTSANLYSNPNDFTIPLRWISIMSNRTDCDLVASTGIHDGSAIIKQILAGASAVQVVSALYKNGLGHVSSMLDEIQKWMDNKGFKNLNDFKGKMNQDISKNPAAYERIQFMKYFSGK